MLHRPENKKECYSHGNKRKSIIYPFHRSEDHANGGCDGGFIAYGVYFYRKCKVFGDSQQCQREFYFEHYGVSGKKIGKAVENEVVKGVVSQLQSGNIPQDAVVTYNFNGTVKYAAYALTSATCFGHPKSGNLSLSNPDKGIRDFWIEHSKRCRAIAEEMGKAQGDPCIMNVWVHDGSKDITVNRMEYRKLLKDSLDEIFATEYKHMKDSIESKVFGIGLESYTVGSNEFYLGYGVKNNKMVTLDTGHFHPTESVADKVSAMLLYLPELMLHVSRPVRWDSDHVTIMDDPTLDLFSEIVRCDALNRVHYGLDYFDASINRIGAYVIGSRAAQKCMIRALLEPLAQLREYEAKDMGFERLALLEEAKALPWNAVYDMFCLKNGVAVGNEFIAEVEKYETDVTSKR